jgi:hypothetical protein
MFYVESLNYCTIWHALLEQSKPAYDVLHTQINKDELNLMFYNITKIEILLILKSAVEFCREMFQNAEFVTVKHISLVSFLNYHPFKVHHKAFNLVMKFL